jgi:NADH dehydrogenase/NADH:ubiquinone oxidoreductase subunit G
MNTIPIIIDDKKIEADPGKTILEICRENEIDILTMCHLKGILDIGACRLCLVEIEGVNKLLSACTTKVAPNIIIRTNTERIRKYQRITTNAITYVRYVWPMVNANCRT